MKNKKKISLLCVLSSSVVIAGAVTLGTTFNSYHTKADVNDYSITLDNTDKFKTGDTTIDGFNTGTKIKFRYNAGFKATNQNAWAEMTKDGFFEINNSNLGALNGLNTLTMNITGKVNVCYSHDVGKVDLFTETFENPDGTVPYNFRNATNPNYIKIVAISDNVTLNSLKFDYSCTDSNKKTIHAYSSNASEGTVTIVDGEGEGGAYKTVTKGHPVTLTATPTGTSTFKGWADETGKIISTENPYKCDVDNDVSIRGIFSDERVWLDFSYNDSDRTAKLIDADDNETNIDIPSHVVHEGNVYTVAEIGESAFSYHSNLSAISIPNTVTSIGDYAFEGCDNLTAISIPDGVKTIGSYAFQYCSNLTNVSIPDTVTSIGDYAFDECNALNYNTNNGVHYLGNSNNLYLACIGYDGDIQADTTIQNGCKFILQNAFMDCTSLSSISIPDGVLSIGRAAFYGCSNLTNISIPNSINSLGSGVFEHCDSLNFTIESGVCYLGNNNNPYLVCVKHNEDAILNNVSIKNNCKFILGNAFQSSSKLHSITIAASVISIGGSAFSACDELNGVSFIGDSSLKTIGESAFQACTSLQTFNVPSNVTTLSEGIFQSCNSLSNVVFRNDSKLVEIKDYAFYECTSLVSITLPNTVTSIGEFVFTNCSNLSSISIPDGIEEVDGPENFEGCDDNLFNVVDGVKYVGNNIHKNLVCVGYDDYSIETNPTIPQDCKIIVHNAFAACEKIKSINIPSNVISINSETFGDCTSLDTVTFEQNSKLKSIGREAFGNCPLTKSFIIPNTVTSIGSSAFVGCRFKTIIIPISVTKMKYGVFYFASLETINCEAESKPKGWDDGWNEECSANVVWNYKPGK